MQTIKTGDMPYSDPSPSSECSLSEIFKMMKDNDIQREDMPQLRKERERKKETLLNFRTGKCLSLNT